MRPTGPIDRERVNRFISDMSSDLRTHQEKWCRDEIPDKAMADVVRFIERRLVDVSTRLLNEADFWEYEGELNE